MCRVAFPPASGVAVCDGLSGTYAQVVSPCHFGLPWGGSLLQ
jgi:hypothetical protein